MMDTENRVKTIISPQYIEDLYYDMAGETETALSYDMIHELKSSLQVYLAYWLPRKKCCIRQAFRFVFSELFDASFSNSVGGNDGSIQTQ